MFLECLDPRCILWSSLEFPFKTMTHLMWVSTQWTWMGVFFSFLKCILFIYCAAQFFHCIFFFLSSFRWQIQHPYQCDNPLTFNFRALRALWNCLTKAIYYIESTINLKPNLQTPFQINRVRDSFSSSGVKATHSVPMTHPKLHSELFVTQLYEESTTSSSMHQCLI